jgi:DNA-binding NarL/FixJ family response regulator
MRVLVLEDDEFQAEELQITLKTIFPGVDIELLATEHEFRQWLARDDAAVPDLAILDVMVRWTDPAEDQPDAPADVVKDGFFTAGLRCYELLAGAERTARVPVILYTVLDHADLETSLDELPRHVAYVAKEIDDRRLTETIIALTQGQPEVPATP